MWTCNCFSFGLKPGQCYCFSFLFCNSYCYCFSLLLLFLLLLLLLFIFPFLLFSCEARPCLVVASPMDSNKAGGMVNMMFYHFYCFCSCNTDPHIAKGSLKLQTSNSQPWSIQAVSIRRFQIISIIIMMIGFWDFHGAQPLAEMIEAFWFFLMEDNFWLRSETIVGGRQQSPSFQTK